MIFELLVGYFCSFWEKVENCKWNIMWNYSWWDELRQCSANQFTGSYMKGTFFVKELMWTFIINWTSHEQLTNVQFRSCVYWSWKPCQKKSSVVPIGVKHLVSMHIFPKSYHFLPPNMRTYMCVSGGKKLLFRKISRTC